jgi:cytochrome P450
MQPCTPSIHFISTSFHSFFFKHAVDLKAQVRTELDEIFGGSDRPCTQEDVSAMKYLDGCIKESLRIYPPVPFILREVTEPINIGLLNEFI